MKGIMFKEDLFQAIIEGRKTQTRRTGGLDIINDGPPDDWGYDGNPLDRVKLLGWEEDPLVVNENDDSNEPIQWKGLYPMFEVPWWDYEIGYFKPRYKEGEILYLKEPYRIGIMKELMYAYDKQPQVREVLKWKNKMFMPEKYARYFIEINRVRVERLQDILEEDAIREGFMSTAVLTPDMLDYRGFYPSEHFREKWGTINGPGSWEKNPWVWVYEFKLNTNQNIVK